MPVQPKPGLTLVYDHGLGATLARPLIAGRAGKELAMAARQEEELRLKRMVEARQREKEEEARAREKIRAKLGEPPARRGTRMACPARRGGEPGRQRSERQCRRP